jgi:hypothetical protein
VSVSQARRWHRRRTARGIASIALLAAASPALGHAAGLRATEPFGLTSTPASDGQPRPYFSLTVAWSGSSWPTTWVCLSVMVMVASVGPGEMPSAWRRSP